ncbi:N-acetylmuramoyl-L-alanine amidase [Cytobacillus praedii]|uniref:N-acetylmuramoyl-L-alanine amidase n=1 Tax=Cytobacillus praedii TaxID=1742358 RepID=UPI002E24C7D0|nr:N-acetylmuramoyl-L-alanine amidase [Cytobacillus praedii]
MSTKDYELILDPGHGGIDPGAVSSEKEKDWTLKISLYQYNRFKELGVPVSLTRSTDISLDSGPRTAKVKNSGAKYCISNHLNAGGGDRGEVIHSIFDSGQLANRLKDQLEAVGQTTVKVYCKQGSKGKDYYYMHRETGAVKTNIVEYCFIDNKADFEHFKKNWEAYAEAVVKGFCSFVGHPYKAPAKDQKEANEVEGKLSAAEEAVVEKAKKLGITDGKKPLKVPNQYYVWNVVIPVMEELEALKEEMAALKEELQKLKEGK